ncbi:MAG: GNAT family N-acetyltransferase [Acidobacteria bacterium]|nr:GNAT family N-acetyltransferase [Acidobacteriota bacterium]
MTHSIQRAVTDEEILSCHPILSELRSHIPASDLVPAVRRMEKEGYRLAFLSDSGKVQAVAGYRMIEMLRTGKMLEVDDLVTASETRSKGYGSVLLRWIFQEARENQCRFVELDSAVHRADAHRFYFRERMHVLGFHFSVAMDTLPAWPEPR